MAVTGDLMDLHPLNKALGAKEHILAVNRDYISQPRLSKY